MNGGKMSLKSQSASAGGARLIFIAAQLTLHSHTDNPCLPFSLPEASLVANKDSPLPVPLLSTVLQGQGPASRYSYQLLIMEALGLAGFRLET